MNFWDGTISWKNKYIGGEPINGRVKWFFGFNKPVQITDAFHFFKMLMIIFICLSITSVLMSDLDLSLINYLIVFIGYGTCWNVVFSLFFDKILKKE